MNEISNKIGSRYNELKRLILDGTRDDPTILNIDGLLDTIFALNDLCSNSIFRNEKLIKNFLENCNYIVGLVLNNR